MKINCIAIEDEPLALKKIRDFIERMDYLNLVGAFDNAVEPIGFLKREKVDLIFLDIRMKKLSGIQFLESLNAKPKIIITSAYSEYALKGYELDVADYLLKPFSFERFAKSVDKIYTQLSAGKGTGSLGYIFLKTEYRIEKVELGQILFVQGMKDYLQVHMTDRKIMTLQTFKNLLEALPRPEFQRVHNSYIVPISKIEHIERNRIYIHDHQIPISNSYKDGFYDLLRDQKILL